MGYSSAIVTEQILAYSGQNSYAQSEGRFIMPGSEPGEGLRPSVGHKQVTRREPHQEAPRRTENRDTKPRESFFKPLNRPENERPLIPFKDAWLAVEVISQIQDGRDVPMSSGEFRKIRELNERFGDADEAKRLEKPEEAICYAQEVLRNSKVEEPKTEDFDYEKGSPHSEKSYYGEEYLAINVARLKVARVQETGGTSVEPEKVAAHLTVEEDDEIMKPFPEMSGPGASAGGTPAWYDRLPDPDTVSDAALARTIRGIQRIGASGEEELSRLKRMQERLDDIAGETPEAQSAERILSNRIRELKNEATAMREDEIKRSRETPPAEDMLKITIGLRKHIKKLMDMDASSPEYAAGKALLQTYLDKAEEIVEGVVDLEETDPNKMKTGTVVYKYDDGQEIRTYRYVFEVTRALDESSKQYTSDSEQAKLADIVGNKDRLDAYAARKRSDRLIHRLDRYFLINYEDKTRDQQDEVVGDIDEKAHHYYHAALSGWRDLDEATRIVLELVDRKDDKDGFREWKATNGFQSIIDAVKIYQMTAEPHDWRDVPKVLSNIFNEIEDTQVSPDDLGSVAQRARQIIARIPQREGGRELRIRLSDRLEAFKAWHVMIMNLDKKDMNPEAAISGFQEYFEGREENTMENFLERFSTDNRGREFYVIKSEDGEQLFDEDKNPIAFERVNTFDVEHALMEETIHSERIKANIIEAMTKYAIEKTFDSRTLREIQIWAGFRNADGTFSEFFDWMEGRTPDEAVQYFNSEVEKLRVYFNDKIRASINDPKSKYAELAGMPVDGIWARKSAFRINGKDMSGVDITQDFIGDWHKQRTLHGAFGTIGRDDLKELAREFGMTFNADEESREWKALRDKFLGESFLKVRRNAIKEQMIAQLKTQGLKVNRNFTEEEGIDLRDADFIELDESGFFGSVEYNTYQWVWIHEWGNLDTIRIYSRDSKSKLDDDYEKVVFHKSSNLFMDRMISHGWEFYHDGNETRGRPKENDVNRIAKQYLPGKHHYLFPQNTASVRWADHFMTDRQKEWVEERVRHLMSVYDSDVPAWHTDAVGWMRNVVIMDMIENGQFKFTQIDPKTGKRIKFSDVVKKKAIGKFGMIDLFSDRTKHAKYLGPEGFQDYLANPSNQKFAELADKTKLYYSTRDARLFSFMVFALRWHWELMNKHNKRLFDRIDMQSATMDNFVESLTSAGVVEKETAVDFKRQNLGFIHYSPKGNQDKISESRPEVAAVLLGAGFPRGVRQALELMRLSGWENKWSLGGSLSALWAMILEYFKRLPGQLGQQR
jgi:hypothetical protein